MSNPLRSFVTGCSTALELARALMRGPYWYLLPLVALLLPAALVLVFLKAAPIVAPFVYTIF